MALNENALLDFLISHLEVTERLIEDYEALSKTVLSLPDIGRSYPAGAQHPTLSELRASTRLLRQRVQAILDRSQ